MGDLCLHGAKNREQKMNMGFDKPGPCPPALFEPMERGFIVGPISQYRCTDL